MARLEDLPLAALRDQLEEFDEHRPMRRLLAAVIYKQGPSVPTIADWFDVRAATVYAWFDRLEAEADLGSAVRDRPRPGRPTRLSGDDRREFLATLGESPEDAGYDARAWTPGLARDHLRDSYGVEYSLRHVRRLLDEAESDSFEPRP